MNYTNRTECINIYFKEIKSFKSMTREDEITLFARIAAGDTRVETEIFNRMAKLAVATAKTYTCDPILLEDLIQEANHGVLTAIRKYDPALGFRFSSYAIWWMKAYISTFLNEMNIVHPTCNSKIIWKAKKIAEEFYMNHQRDITEVELLEALEEMGEVVTDVTVLVSIKSVRIDNPINDDDRKSQMELEVFTNRTKTFNEYEDQAEDDDLASLIKSRLNRLNPRERELILLKFGFTTGYEFESYDALTKEWNKGKTQYLYDENGDVILNDKGDPKKNPEYLTQERVRQIVIAALKKMK